MRKYLVMLTAIALAGCATTGTGTQEKTKQGAGVGALIGAVAGAVIGHQADRTGGALKGALLGAAGGAAIGAGAGAYMDKQQEEFERQLEEERASHQIEIERLKNENLKITMVSEASFDFDSADINPAFEPALNKVGDIVGRYYRTTIAVVGHTDSTGSAEYNQQLSEARAQSVSTYLQQQGVSSRRIQTEGRGEHEPRVSNDTEAGQQLNRRVEITIIPDRDIS